jgi:hypothetical protein
MSTEEDREMLERWLLDAEAAHMAAVHKLFEVFPDEQADAIVTLLDAKQEHTDAASECADPTREDTP